MSQLNKAAPQLLAALKRLETEIVIVGVGTRKSRAIDLLPESLVKQIREAIAKAEKPPEAGNPGR